MTLLVILESGKGGETPGFRNVDILPFFRGGSGSGVFEILRLKFRSDGSGGVGSRLTKGSRGRWKRGGQRGRTKPSVWTSCDTTSSFFFLSVKLHMVSSTCNLRILYDT